MSERLDRGTNVAVKHFIFIFTLTIANNPKFRIQIANNNHEDYKVLVFR
jgi:hypothetical protein